MPFRSIEDRREYQREYYRSGRKTKTPHQTRKRSDERKIHFPLRLPETVVGQFRRMAFEAEAHGTAPWKSASEVCKAMIYEGLRNWKGESESLADYRPIMEFQINLEDTLQAHRQVRTMYAKAREVIDVMMEKGAETEALQYYHSTMEFSRSLPPTIWRASLLRDMEQAYPQFAAKEAQGKVKGVAFLVRRPVKVVKDRRATPRHK